MLVHHLYNTHYSRKEFCWLKLAELRVKIGFSVKLSNSQLELNNSGKNNTYRTYRTLSIVSDFENHVYHLTTMSSLLYMPQGSTVLLF